MRIAVTSLLEQRGLVVHCPPLTCTGDAATEVNIRLGRSAQTLMTLNYSYLYFDGIHFRRDTAELFALVLPRARDAEAVFDTVLWKSRQPLSYDHGENLSGHGWKANRSRAGVYPGLDVTQRQASCSAIRRICLFSQSGNSDVHACLRDIKQDQQRDPALYQ